MDTHYPETADIETASDGYASRFSGEIGTFFLQIQTAITLSNLRHLPKNAEILDIGGGHAQLTPILIENGYRLTVTGSDDICSRRLETACPRGEFSYITCNSLALPFNNASFDAVISFRLLPHTHNWLQLLAEMCRVAKQTVLFDYPDKRSTNILYTSLFKVKKHFEGNTRTFTLFTRDEIRKVLCKEGFENVRFTPEFFFPMVFHRKLNKTEISRLLERCSSRLFLTQLFGSPIITRADRTH